MCVTSSHRRAWEKQPVAFPSHFLSSKGGSEALGWVCWEQLLCDPGVSALTGEHRMCVTAQGQLFVTG